MLANAREDRWISINIVIHCGVKFSLLIIWIVSCLFHWYTFLMSYETEIALKAVILSVACKSNLCYANLENVATDLFKDIIT